MSTIVRCLAEFVDKPVDMPADRTDDPLPHRPRTDDGDRCPRGAQGKPGHEPRRQRETVGVTPAGASRSPAGRRRGRGGAGDSSWRAPGLPDRAPLPADPSRCPSLPPDAEAALADGLVSMGLGGLPSTDATALADHLRLLLAWTTAVNLTAIRDPRAAVMAHVIDALAAVPLLRRHGIRALLDLGSGGGYPGLPLVIALPAERALLVDSIGKKARFLATAVTGLGLTDRVDVAAERAEALAADPRHRARWPAVTARAVAALPELVELAFPLLEPGGLLVAWKASESGEEQARAIPALAALGGGTLDVVETAPPVPAGHVLVVCRKTGRTPVGWPRPPVERRRHPW